MAKRRTFYEKHKKHIRIALIIIAIAVLLSFIGCQRFSITESKTNTSSSIGQKLSTHSGSSSPTNPEQILNIEGAPDIDWDCVDEHAEELMMTYFTCMYDDCAPDRLHTCLDECAERDDVMLLSAPESEVYKFIEIIPTAHAIVFPEETCEDDCYADITDREYDEMYECADTTCIGRTMLEGARLGCITAETETGVWNGKPVTNIGSFFETTFPTASTQLQTNCEGFPVFGTWVSNENYFGCLDEGWGFGLTMLFPCDGASATSFNTVCTQVGYNWNCSPFEASCSED